MPHKTQMQPGGMEIPQWMREIPTSSVAAELSALRDEIKTLREALNPPKSALITGPEVERVFKALKGTP